MYRQKNKNVGLINIGGISNITILPKNCQKEDVYAFDMGPGNMMINEACHQLYHISYDKDGMIAKKGRLIEWIEDGLYALKKPPKSTGREEFGQFYVEQLLNQYQHEKKNDIITTLTYFTAYCIAYHIKQYVLIPLDEIIISGGGAYNLTLIQMIRDLLKDIPVLTQEDMGMSSEAKEAIAFVIMANETLHHQPSNMKSATGAKDDVILGNIIYPPIINKGDKL